MASCSDEVDKIQSKDLALFIIGSFKEQLLIMNPQNKEFVAGLIDKEIQNAHPLVKVRILWLIEKMASHDNFFRGQDSQGDIQAIFEKLVGFFIDESQGFPPKYQCLRALYRFTKKINLKEVYSHNLEEILGRILVQINGNLLPNCNEDNIHIPIQALTYFCQIDKSTTRKFSELDPTFVTNLLSLYHKFNQDGFMGEDVMDLIKIISGIPGNQRFKQVFFPLIRSTLLSFYNSVMSMK